ncbi:MULTISPECIES: hypothetical protein [Methylococcus]|uniref:Uncharacterized protein n=1 Tax=Methylococcus capsulatus TaxID=414 RepID=A0ABZ2F5G5_METCP|nr:MULTISPECIES: hypothetical protein [Methylococcus]
MTDPTQETQPTHSLQENLLETPGIPTSGESVTLPRKVVTVAVVIPGLIIF